MSNKYKHGDRVPTEVLCARLDQLATAVTKGRDGINREFYMSIPAELDHDADLVISEASKRLMSMTWISVEDRQPEHGQKIVGFAYCNEGEPGAHGVWDEVWDNDEPIGAMTHWIPIPDKL